MLGDITFQTLLKHLFLEGGAEKTGLDFYFREEARGHLETFYSHCIGNHFGKEMNFYHLWVIMASIYEGGSVPAVPARLQISHDLMLLSAKVSHTEKTCMLWSFSCYFNFLLAVIFKKWIYAII